MSYQPTFAILKTALDKHKDYILECGCINSCGFYAASIEDIVFAITNYCKTNQN